VIDDTENFWVVAFISKTCLSCIKLADTWGSLLKLHDIDVRKIKLAYIDVDEPNVQQDIIENYCGTIKVDYTPTILFYGKDKSDPTMFEGPMSDYTVEKIGSKVVELSGLNGFKLKKIPTGAQNTPVKPDVKMTDFDANQLVNLREVAQKYMDGKFDISIPSDGFK